MPGKCQKVAICAAILVLPAPGFAHPHVWIDTRIEVILNTENQATGVRIGWTYDDLYSLYIIGDMGLDPDWDGALTPEEETRLSGFDMKWDPGYAGDTYALLGEDALVLSAPQEWTAGYAEGRISSTHLRMFVEPVPVAEVPLILQVYDPGYYVAYAIPFDPVLTGGHGCKARVFVPDLDAADEELKAALEEYTPDIDLETEFPAIGAAYAEEVRVTCVVEP